MDQDEYKAKVERYNNFSSHTANSFLACFSAALALEASSAVTLSLKAVALSIKLL